MSDVTAVAVGWWMRRIEEGFGKQSNISGVQLDWEILGKVAVNPNSNKELNIDRDKQNYLS